MIHFIYGNTKKVQADFFKTENGNEPVRDFLKALDSDDKKSVGADIMAIEMSWPVGYPKGRQMDTDLWEVRTSISDKRICRIFFTVTGKKDDFTSCNNKKSQKTPLEELELAKTRKKLALGGKNESRIYW